ncbi:MAG TPA: histidinol-phosphate transaminase [Cyclobacteriaceae bacterium]|nr:histidinol-phosphate transaminase [Cyclobacteriaceae bacterium]
MKKLDNPTTINRRTWLKNSALLTGSIVTTLGLPNFAEASAAFGMKPFQGTHSLLERYHLAPAIIPEMKARLLANENPWGPSKNAIKAIADNAHKGNRYVYNSSMKMVEVLTKKEGVTADQILLAPGSTDILEKTAFALCMNGGNVVSADPTYLSLINTATKIGATWKNIPLKKDYSHDLDAMAAAIDSDTKLVYICNPNNPTGTITPIEELKAFCKKVSSKVPVFIDEAYLDLMEDPARQTAAGLIAEGHDVIVARTFSKIHGMAGLRIGYMVAAKDRVEKIKKLVRTEMGICVTSLEGAMASLADVEFQDFTRVHNKESRDYAFAELQKAGMDPIPSYTSFILFPLQMPVKDFLGKMMEKGVGIRGYEINGKPYGRVSMGTMEEMQLFVKSLNEIVS